MNELLNNTPTVVILLFIIRPIGLSILVGLFYIMLKEVTNPYDFDTYIEGFTFLYLAIGLNTIAYFPLMFLLNLIYIMVG